MRSTPHTRNRAIRFVSGTLLILWLLAPQAVAVAADLVLMVIDNNSYIANLAVSELDTGVDVKVVSAGGLDKGGEELRQRIDGARVIVVDVMGRELVEYLTERIDLANKRIYALRGSIDDERLKRLGFVFDEEVAGYYSHISRENIRNMLRLVIHRHIDDTVSYDAVKKRPGLGIYHPEAPGIFTDAGSFLDWQAGRPGYDPQRPRIGLVFFPSFLTEGQREPVEHLIRRLEDAGFTVMPCFGRDQDVLERLLLDKNGRARVDIVLAYSLKFYSALTPRLAELLKKLDVPVISAINLYRDTADEWRRSPVGIGSMEVTWTMATPEISGLVEPTVLSAKERVGDGPEAYYIGTPVEENIERLIPRLRAWVNLRRKPNPDKRVAVIFYNHRPGKQNVGASYLNVFASIREIMESLAGEGYRTGEVPDEKEIKRLVLAGARNVGSWAPGELEAMVESGEAVQIELDTYRKWFGELPEEFRGKVSAQWGEPDGSGIMTYKGRIVIPAVQRGNVLLMPEPPRGWSDDPMKLYHDTTLYPHHQYIAAYLWLSKVFRADAVIHLGTHATYEWTPGKQAGLAPPDSPEVLTREIPNLYPYIVDDVGEAIQAKRRGRGVMLSHLTPMLRRSGLYGEYERMAELVDEYEHARAQGSVTAPEKLKELERLARATGLLSDIEKEVGLHDAEDKDGLVRLIGHHLDEIREEMIPHGMHTYGRAPAREEAKEMAEAVAARNPGMSVREASKLISSSAGKEVENLLRGLDGRYVEPGEGNDPLRNPGALPTGRNLYGFNPTRLPTREAWRLGKKAADEIIRRYLEKHGTYPEKVAVVLWAVELMRNEGVNESTVLWLMGIRPRWLASGRVTGLEVVPGRELGRPRIDVLVNASGLYRDLFPDKMKLLDEAVKLAVRQTDIENLIARNSRRIRTRLVDAGMDEEEAMELSRLRIFSEEPGSYGNGVSEMTGASGLWTGEDEIVDVYERRMGFVFGGGYHGREARDLLRENLTGVDAVVHSRSSNLYGLLDNDDMFQYLGGLAMAVRRESGQAPATLVTLQTGSGSVRVEDAARTLGREMRSRYLNPAWIEGMKKEDYAGARAMADFVEYLWGWQVTTPDKVDRAKWRQVHEVYVEDKYGLALAGFFAEASPWAYQSMTGRMLEAIRKGYWKADDAVRRRLAAAYARSVVTRGVACCEHTCNNPLLNRMVVSIISVPGVMSPEMVERFRLAVERAAKKTLEEQVAERLALQSRIAAPAEAGRAGGEERKSGSNDAGGDEVEVEGYRMERIKKADDTTEVSSSGLEWVAAAAVLALTALIAFGAWRSRGGR